MSVLLALPWHQPPLLVGALSLAASLAAIAILVYGQPYLVFAYNCFLKPISNSSRTARGKDQEHTTARTGGQQDALESFYKGQAAIYDATRARLLRGRDEMLALAAAQLRLKNQRQGFRKRIWVDVYCLLFPSHDHS